MLSDGRKTAAVRISKTVLILVVMEDALWQFLYNSSGFTIGVLILVVMEDALWQFSILPILVITTRVLILVVMEDALWLVDIMIIDLIILRLNPCCNGRCSLTIRSKCDALQWEAVLILVVMEDALWRYNQRVFLSECWVLILVVMEDALWLCSEEMTPLVRSVLILVVMEDALWPSVRRPSIWWQGCLNPCCNGRCSLTGRSCVFVDKGW